MLDVFGFCSMPHFLLEKVKADCGLSFDADVIMAEVRNCYSGLGYDVR